MESIKVALLGLGTVGMGVYQTIETHQQLFIEKLGRPVEVVGILVRNPHKKRDIPKHIPITTSFDELMALPKLDIVIEATVGNEPARSYILQAMARGCHVITANKKCTALHGVELFEAAAHHGVRFEIEATVAGGVPIIRTLNQLLQVNGIKRIEAILNGTTNYILTRMRNERISFHQALKEAQQAGYAEADPTSDIEGHDSLYKLTILAATAFGDQPSITSMKRKGIEDVELEDLLIAEKFGLRLRLIATIEQEKHDYQGSLSPTLVPDTHPLYHVEGVDNGIHIETDLIGKLFLQGPGAGAFPTASSILEDLIHVQQNTHHDRKAQWKKGKSTWNHALYDHFLIIDPKAHLGKIIKKLDLKHYPENIKKYPIRGWKTPSTSNLHIREEIYL